MGRSEMESLARKFFFVILSACYFYTYIMYMYSSSLHMLDNVIQE